MTGADALLPLAESIARETGALLLDHFRSGRLVTSAKSSPTDLVSEADLEAEQLVRDRLAQARPDDAILGEEGGDTGAGSSGVRWVVDPLDGTTNFLFGVPQWGVSIAAEGPDGTIAGAVYDPVLDELWSTDGERALLNGAPVIAPGRTDLATALVATGFGYEAGVREQQAQVIARVLPRVRDIRRFGSAALDLCWTAAGRYDAYFERGVKPWDIAAGVLVCRAAGLDVRELASQPPAATGVLVAAPALADALEALVR